MLVEGAHLKSIFPSAVFTLKLRFAGAVYLILMSDMTLQIRQSATSLWFSSMSFECTVSCLAKHFVLQEIAITVEWEGGGWGGWPSYSQSFILNVFVSLQRARFPHHVAIRGYTFLSHCFCSKCLIVNTPTWCSAFLSNLRIFFALKPFGVKQTLSISKKYSFFFGVTNHVF